VTYLSVQNFWKYQDRNAWKKAKTHPPWFKHYVHRDPELDKLPLAARLLFIELLGVATRYANVIEADLNGSEWDLNALWAETRIPPEVIAENLQLLIKGGWLSQTKTRRRGTGFGTQKSPDSDVQDVDVEEDIKNKDLALEGPTSNGHDFAANVVADSKPVREHKPYDPPTDSLGHIRRLIANGAILDVTDLEVELRSGDHHLTDQTVDELRALLT
jgi:hypothetical protein